MPQVLGAHLYGPYFRLEARGCHSAAPLENRNWADALALAGHSDEIRTATIAPELSGMEQIARAYAERGVRLNVGHSLATFEIEPNFLSGPVTLAGRMQVIVMPYARR